MRKYSHYPKMIMWVLTSPIFDSIWQLKNKLFTDEIKHEPQYRLQRQRITRCMRVLLKCFQTLT